MKVKITTRNILSWIKTVFINVVAICFIIIFFEAYLAYDEFDREFGIGRVTDTYEKGSRTHINTNEKYPVDLYPNATFVFEELKKEGKRGIKRFSPGALVVNDMPGIDFEGETVFPFAGVSNIGTVYCKESGFWVVYDSDEHGFRNKKGTWKDAKKVSPDVVLLGDSFTQGACIEESDTFSSAIRRTGRSVINTGVGGTGPIIQYGIFKEYIAPVKPKKVLWMFFAEDIRDAVTEAKNPLLSNYLSDAGFKQDLMNKQDLIDKSLSFFYEVGYPKMLYDLTNKRQDRKYIVTAKIVERSFFSGSKSFFQVKKLIRSLHEDVDPTEGNEEHKLDLFQTVLSKMNEEIKGWGGELVFAYIPTWVQYGGTKDSYGISVTDNYLLKKDIINIVEEHGVKSIDLDSEFIRKNDAPHTMYNDNKYGHFHPTAYREIGEYLAERFEKLTR